MLWLSKHARLRNNLSPYIDGQLTPAEAERLEAHLDSCDACRAELEELRATISAVSELPSAAVPRSFALTPRMLERRGARTAASLPPLATGMRLASGAVTVVLAVVIIGDLSGVGGGGNGEEAGGALQEQARTTIEFSAEGEEASPGDRFAPAVGDEDEAEAESADRDSSATPVPGGQDVAASCPPGAAGPASGGGAAGAGTSGTAAPTPGAEATPTSAVDAEALRACDEAAAAPEGTAPPAEGAPSAGDEEAPGEQVADELAAGATEDGSGISTLRVVELVLAGSLVALLGAALVEFALRR